MITTGNHVMSFADVFYGVLYTESFPHSTHDADSFRAIKNPNSAKITQLCSAVFTARVRAGKGTELMNRRKEGGGTN